MLPITRLTTVHPSRMETSKPPAAQASARGKTGSKNLAIPDEKAIPKDDDPDQDQNAPLPLIVQCEKNQRRQNENDRAKVLPKARAARTYARKEHKRKNLRETVASRCSRVGKKIRQRVRCSQPGGQSFRKKRKNGVSRP